MRRSERERGDARAVFGRPTQQLSILAASGAPQVHVALPGNAPAAGSPTAAGLLVLQEGDSRLSGVPETKSRQMGRSFRLLIDLRRCRTATACGPDIPNTARWQRHRHRPPRLTPSALSAAIGAEVNLHCAHSPPAPPVRSPRRDRVPAAFPLVGSPSTGWCVGLREGQAKRTGSGSCSRRCLPTSAGCFYKLVGRLVCRPDTGGGGEDHGALAISGQDYGRRETTTGRHGASRYRR